MWLLTNWGREGDRSHLITSLSQSLPRVAVGAELPTHPSTGYSSHLTDQKQPNVTSFPPLELLGSDADRGLQR